MAEVIAGQSVTLLAQFYDFAGGTLVNLDATPSLTITSVATGSTALAATSSGVTHPATGSYGYVWTPGSGLTPGLYLATWSGLKSAAPVTATEEITVVALGDSADTNTSPEGIWYTTREDVMGALDVKLTARNRRYVDQVIEAASRSVEGLCHRRFYPVQATRFYDWPARPSGAYTPWILRLTDSDLISLASAVSGGRTIPTGDLNLEPNRVGPPFSRVEIKLSTSASYGGGDTYQRDVTLTGLWGYRLTETALGATAGTMNASQRTVTVDGPTSAEVGVGSILRIDSERLLVTERALASTGQTGTIGGSKNDVTLTVSDGTAFAADEVLTIDAERIRVEDIAGNTLIVERACDGSVLAAHTSATIYAPRTLTVTRGALGTTADSHSSASTVYRFEPPGLVRQLAKAEALWSLLQERSGWFRRSATSGNSTAEVSRDAIEALRDQTYTEHGRKARHRAV
ncbi:hypothetical protein [Streptomyces sp. NPDC001139]